ncbi:MAG TPA: preprotein translocase subunit SecE [Sphingomicrobium sp.]|nr:preprotein translocase subunit SecE [Sphingomicrobium sp.]
MAKVSVGEFVRQVRSEGIEKVHWPTMADTRRTAIMVIIMTSALGVFFLGTDSTFSAIVQYLLGLLG